PGHAIAMPRRPASRPLRRGAAPKSLGQGVTADQFVLLAELAGGDAVPQRELARRTASDPNTTRAMLLLLERRGFVVRARHPTDARARTVRLTATGRRMYERLWADSEPVRARLLAALGPADADALLPRLARV